ncbi:MAG: serine--tRNA ligase [Candidatus Obscuribacterales bacterium]|jgi:seryl-tRNA synthetase|nr:serine--tRNA ligase [Candidatus Obscuribacterales bacterium]
MIDLTQLKEKEQQIREAIAKKHVDLDFDKFLAVHSEQEKLKEQVDRLRQVRNELTETIARANVEDKANLIARSKENNIHLQGMEAQLIELQKQWQELAARLPGLPHPNAPVGRDEHDNIERYKWGNPRTLEETPRDHLELANLHQMVDFDQARELAGSRAYALTGWGALLEMAAMRFAFDHILAKGYTPVAPPVMVRENAMYGTGYFPVGQENAYELTKDKLFLTGTAEVGMVALQAGKTFDIESLPKRFVGMSTCFRREAGAAGRDTRGLYRMHQFQKVEQVVICPADEKFAQEEHDQLLANAEEILQALELPYRVVECCTGELGLGQYRKYDIETWMPSRKGYGETHSASNLRDFQARRLNIRHRDAAGQKHFAYTLNNTAIASPRILIALIENHQQADGKIYIPKALRRYLGDTESI